MYYFSVIHIDQLVLGDGNQKDEIVMENNLF